MCELNIYRAVFFVCEASANIVFVWILLCICWFLKELGFFLLYSCFSSHKPYASTSTLGQCWYASTVFRRFLTISSDQTVLALLDNRSILGLRMECWGLPAGFFRNSRPCMQWVSSCTCYRRVFWLFPGLIAGWHQFQLAHQMGVYGCGFVRICTSLGVRSRHRRPMSKKKDCAVASPTFRKPSSLQRNFPFTENPSISIIAAISIRHFEMLNTYFSICFIYFNSVVT